ncbi:WD40 repeat-like protein [Imleria badia]|nr:WD40 repeat-like protein [Imleria badia]
MKYCDGRLIMSSLGPSDQALLARFHVNLTSVGLAVDCTKCGGSAMLSICKSDRNGNAGKPVAKHPQCSFYRFFPLLTTSMAIMALIPAGSNHVQSSVLPLSLPIFLAAPASSSHQNPKLARTKGDPCTYMSCRHPQDLHCARAKCQIHCLEEGGCPFLHVSLADEPEIEITPELSMPTSFEVPLQAEESLQQVHAGKNGPRPHSAIPAHNDAIRRLAYLPDGRRVVTGSDDGTVRVWNLESGKQEGTSMEHENKVDSLAVTRDGTKIVSSDEDGSIKMWNVESHELVQNWKAHSTISHALAISPDDRLVAVCNWTLGIYSMAGRQVNRAIEVGGLILSVAFSPDGNKLACGTLCDIRIYEVSSGALMFGPLNGHKDMIWCVLWSPDGSRLFSASQDKTIRCWDSEIGRPIEYPWTGHTDKIYFLSLSPDGSILASASEDRTIRFWDAATGNPIRVGRHLDRVDAVTAVCFSPSGEFVASAGRQGMIYLWRVPWLHSIENQAIQTAPGVSRSQLCTCSSNRVP